MSQIPDVPADVPDLTAEFVQRFNARLPSVVVSNDPTDPAELDSLRDQLARASDELERVKEARRQLESQLASCVEQIETQNKTLEQLRIDADPNEGTVFRSVSDDTEIENLRKENRDLRTKTQRQAAQVQALTTDNSETWKANDSFSKSIKQKTREVEALQAKLAALKQNDDRAEGTSATEPFSSLEPIEGSRDELLGLIRDELNNISRLDSMYQQYGLDLAKVPADRLGELAAIYAQEHEIKKMRHAHVIRTRHR